MMHAPRLIALLPAQGPPDILPSDVLPILNSVLMTLVVIALGIPIVRALTRRFLAPPRPPMRIDAETASRLARIEEAVDTIAIEVERISEAQRFQSKLLAEGRGASRGAEEGVRSAVPRERDSSR